MTLRHDTANIAKIIIVKNSKRTHAGFTYVHDE
jgi:hypothetical protein